MLDRGSLPILWPTIVLSITGLAGAVRQPSSPGAHWLGQLSVDFLVLGLVTRWTAIFTLGRSFTANVSIPASQTVPKTGLFHFACHPSYTGLLLILIAVGLASRNWLSFVIVTVFRTAALLDRIHVEEAALTQAFGKDYLEYSRATKGLILVSGEPGRMVRCHFRPERSRL